LKHLRILRKEKQYKYCSSDMRSSRVVRRVLKKALLILIKGYKAAISPIIDGIFGSGNTCRFSPTCSEYTYQAVEKYGVLQGVLMGLKRIFRCHPWAKGGHDPVS